MLSPQVSPHLAFFFSLLNFASMWLKFVFREFKGLTLKGGKWILRVLQKWGSYRLLQPGACNQVQSRLEHSGCVSLA